jgi:hypothetical protein
MTRLVQIGDWICFQQLGSPTYALVLYILDEGSRLGRKVVTTNGEIHESSILEIR